MLLVGKHVTVVVVNTFFPITRLSLDGFLFNIFKERVVDPGWASSPGCVQPLPTELAGRSLPPPETLKIRK